MPEDIQVLRVPYVCTVPRRGIQEIQSFPDVRSFVYEGMSLAYSKRANAILTTDDDSEWRVREDQSIRSDIFYLFNH